MVIFSRNPKARQGSAQAPVNRGSRSVTRSWRLPFTVPPSLLWVAILASASTLAVGTAQADRVVVLRTSGDGDLERLHLIEEHIAEAVSDAGHSPITEQGTSDPNAPHPDTANELHAVADVHQSNYVLASSALLLEDAYRLHLVIGYAPETRREEIDVLVWNRDERARLTEVLRAALRPEGIGARRGALEIDPPAPVEASDSDPEVNEPVPETPAAAGEAPQDAIRPPRSPWTLSAGVDARPLFHFPDPRDGGTLVAFSLRLGHHLQGVEGLELRGVLEGHGGAAGGLLVGAGAAFWFLEFSDLNLRVAAAGEIGFHQAVTGDQAASFMARIAPLVAWDVTDSLFLEASALEVQVLTANNVWSLGFGLRAGMRL